MVLVRIQSELGKTISRNTLRRALKSMDHSYRRVKKSLRSKRNDQAFEAKKEIATLKVQEDDQEIVLYYFDGSGFSLVPYVPYCWQKKGETIEIDSSRSRSINVLGFLKRDNTFAFHFVDGSVDSELIVAVFEHFISTLDEGKKTVIIMDNAPKHTSAYFEAQKARWKNVMWT
jgi:hypothetical protein